MSDRQTGPYDGVAGRWLALVERRQQHFIELCASGRWRHYYTQAEFLKEMRKVLHVRDQWALIAGLPVSDAEPSDDDLLPDRHYGSLYRTQPTAGMPATAWPE
jgi:uncharacterized repeat protein (TIGR03809 family)